MTVKERSADFQKANDALPAEIGKRQRAEEALRASEQRLQDILDNSTAVVSVKDLELRYVLVNREYERRLHVQRDQIVGKTDFDIHPQEIAETVRSNDQQVIETGMPVQYQVVMPMADGKRPHVVVKFLLRNGTGQPYGVCSIATDVTELKRAEQKLARLNRTLQTLYQCNHALVRATEEYELLRSVCQILVETGSMRMAWVGYREPNEEKTVRPVAQAGYEDGYLERINVSWADTERGWGPMGMAIRTGKISSNRDILTDPRMAPWRAEALKRGYASSVALPLRCGGEAFGALALYAEEPDAFNETTIEHYTDLANNLAYGVMTLRTREERVRATEALRTSEQRLQDVVDNTTAVIFVKDLELRYLLVNREYERRHRVQRDQIRGKTDFDFHPRDVAEAVRANDRQVIESGAPIQFEEAVPSAAGERWLICVKFLLRDSIGKPYAVCGIATDITERKRAESEIRQLNALLEKRVTERTVELVQSNNQLRRAEEELRKRSEQVQKHRNVLLELAHSDKSDLAKALRQICSVSASALEVARVSYWSLQEDGCAIRCEVLYLRSTDGFDEQSQGGRLGVSDCPAYFKALATNRPIVADRALAHPATSCLAENYLRPLGISSMLDAPVWTGGEVVGVLCHEHIGPARDWSAEEIDFVSALAATVSLALQESRRADSERLLRESEARFRALFEGTSQAVALHDETGVLEVNPSWLRLLGYSSLDEVVGKHPAELSAPIQAGDERAEVLAAKHIHTALAHGSAQFEWTVLRADGTELPMEVLLTPIQLGGGRQLIQAVCSDITERKRAETELLRTLAREKELGQLRSNFVSMVSHEFRTPLGIIQSSAEILEDYFEQLEPAERKEHLQSIRKNTRRMAGLMEEVLLIGSLEAGKLEFKPRRLALPAFIRKLVDEVGSATHWRCRIESLLDGAPDQVAADERLLRHILTNLLTNAVKYSDPGQPVRLEIGRADPELVCAIRDRGIGITDADQEWLFSAFHRGQNVGERPGTGLGLVIVKRCVDLHGGKIEVWSQLGQGTVMTVRLPVFGPPGTAAGA